VQRGLFAYALGDGETFDTIYFQEPRPSGDFAVVEGAWLLRPALAARLIGEPPPPRSEPREEERPDEGLDKVPSPPPPAPPANVYRYVTIDTSVDWQQWYEFYQAVVQPLIEAGAEVSLHLRLEASGEIDANLVDLSVKESVLQLNPQGKVDVEG
jgi:hypothetical protein